LLVDLREIYICETHAKLSGHTVTDMFSTLRRIFLTVTLIGSTATFLACRGQQGQSGETGSGTGSRVITADGSSTVFPVTEAVAEEFQKAIPGTRVTVGRSGTGGGFQKFCRNEIDISNASRPIRAVEIEACQKAGVAYVELPVAYDGLAVVVNPKNTWVQSMTVADLKKLWEPAAQGKILRWNQIRPEWPNQEIHLFGAGVDSGTFDYFTEVIVGKATQSRGDYTSSEDDNVIVQGVSGDQYALGYFGYAYYEENKDKLKIVPIDSGKGPVTPSPETVANGTYTPLSRPIFIYPKVQALDRSEVRSFVDFYLTKGIALVREVGYVPLTESEYQLVRKRVEDRKVGTMFEGSGGGTLSERLSR
jgi:phosphate transport system substrate-binding protein